MGISKKTSSHIYFFHNTTLRVREVSNANLATDDGVSARKIENFSEQFGKLIGRGYVALAGYLNDSVDIDKFHTSREKRKKRQKNR